MKDGFCGRGRGYSGRVSPGQHRPQHPPRLRLASPERLPPAHEARATHSRLKCGATRARGDTFEAKMWRGQGKGRHI